MPLLPIVKQDGCSTLQEFVSAFGSDMGDADKAGSDQPSFDGGEAAGFSGGDGLRHWSKAPVVSMSGDSATAGDSGGGKPFSLRGGDDTALSLVLAFLARVMAPTAHEASALRTGGRIYIYIFVGVIVLRFASAYADGV